MKRFSAIIFAVLIFLAGSCARHTIISDDELAQIFHDAFLANAYIEDRSFGEQRMRFDSLNIYEPIFARYGYTTSDVQYTIGNFSKRKSARLGDVVERAIVMLERESKLYEHEVAILDTIDQVALRTFTRPIFTDSLIRLSRLRDTSKLRLCFDVRAGEYLIQFRYKIDSLDRNKKGLRTRAWFENRDGKQILPYNYTMRPNRDLQFSRRMKADTSHRKLCLDIVLFNDKPQRPSVTIRDLEIQYIPQAAIAVDSLYLKQLDIRLFADEFFSGIQPKDSL